MKARYDLNCVKSAVKLQPTNQPSCNVLNSLGEICSEYSLASNDDLIRFWRSKVKDTTGSQSQNLWTSYLMNGLSNHDETWVYSLAPIDDLLRLWRS